MNRVKRLVRMLFSRTSFRFLGLSRYRFNYAGEVGDTMSSSTVAAPVLWFARNFPEAPPALWRKLDNGQEEQLRRHDLLDLLERPNPHYTGPILWWSTTIDWNVNGEGYWLVIPSRADTPAQLWWTPSWMMEPKGSDSDRSTYVDHYEYTVDGEPHKLDPRWVIHFRHGLDPDNPRRGTSPLKSVLREVFTDNEAADFTASLLRNMGVPGLVLSPEGGVVLNEQEAKDAKADVTAKFTGENRGEPFVSTVPMKLQQFGFSPEQLLLRELRRIPEERVTAVLGVPAIVAGLGAGLERSTFTNMAEAREAAYESGLIPAQKILGEDVRFQLLPLFGDDPFDFRFGFDLAKVRVLQEDLTRQALRWGGMVRDGYAMIAEARRGMGLEVDADRDNKFLRPANAVEVDGATGEQTSLAPAALGNGNGKSNGALDAADIAAIGDEMDRRTQRRELAPT